MIIQLICTFTFNYSLLKQEVYSKMTLKSPGSATITIHSQPMTLRGTGKTTERKQTHAWEAYAHQLFVHQAKWSQYETWEQGATWNGPGQANLVLIAYASSEDSGEPAHPCSLARTSAARSYKQWVKWNLQTESQIPGSSEWLGMRI